MTTPLDGSALAGAMAELFAVDLTSAIGRCVGCGISNPLGRVEVYMDAPGAVARCPNCQHVLMRLVRSPDRVWLDMQGIRSLELQLPNPSA
jgi:Family of unknown function (DUF6510)